MSTMGRGPPLMAALTVVLLAAVATTPGALAILVDPVTVTGTVMGSDLLPVDGARVAVVGMGEYNTTTDADGNYTLLVPFQASGHSIEFTSPDHQRKVRQTGELVENGLVELNVTLTITPPTAVLHININPWDIPGQNYGLRQDYIYVENAPGTAFFNYSERSSEETVTVPAPGTYYVTGTRPGYYGLRLEVTVDRGDRLDVNIDLSDRKKPTFGIVSGTVTNQGLPMPGAVITAEPEEGERTYNAVTNLTGGYELELPKGNFTLRVELAGYSRLSEGVSVVLGETYEVDFPVTVEQDTGEEDSPIIGWIGFLVAVVVLVSVTSLAIVHNRRAAREREEAEAASDALYCPECGAEASEADERCSRCGAAFPWRSFRCPDCGAVMELDAKRCPECGNETFDLHQG